MFYKRNGTIKVFLANQALNRWMGARSSYTRQLTLWHRERTHRDRSIVLYKHCMKGTGMVAGGYWITDTRARREGRADLELTSQNPSRAQPDEQYIPSPGVPRWPALS